MQANQLAFRPRYKFVSDYNSKQIIDLFHEKLSRQKEKRIFGSVMEHHIILRFYKKYQHFWSPQMDIMLEEDLDTGKTLVRCLIAPAPKVWTMFMFGSIGLGVLAFFGLMLGFAQYTIHQPMWGFWLVPVSLIGMVVLWLFALEGKKLAKDEMHELKHFVDEVFGCNCLENAL